MSWDLDGVPADDEALERSERGGIVVTVELAGGAAPAGGEPDAGGRLDLSAAGEPPPLLPFEGIRDRSMSSKALPLAAAADDRDSGDGDTAETLGRDAVGGEDGGDGAETCGAAGAGVLRAFGRDADAGAPRSRLDKSGRLDPRDRPESVGNDGFGAGGMVTEGRTVDDRLTDGGVIMDRPNDGMTAEGPAPAGLVNAAPAPAGLVNVAPAPAGLVKVAPAPAGLVNVAPAPAGLVNVAPAPAGLVNEGMLRLCTDKPLVGRGVDRAAGGATARGDGMAGPRAARPDDGVLPALDRDLNASANVDARPRPRGSAASADGSTKTPAIKVAMAAEKNHRCCGKFAFIARSSAKALLCS